MAAATPATPAGDKTNPEPAPSSPNPGDRNPPAPTASIQNPEEIRRNCQMWLLLARNFYNAKKYDLAEANVKKVLDSRPDDKMLEEAKELLKKIQADQP